MFDDEKKEGGGEVTLSEAPTNLPVPPSSELPDMFEKDEAMTTPVMQPSISPTFPEAQPAERTAPLAPVVPEKSSSGGMFLVIFIVLFVILIVLGVSAYFAYRAFMLAPEPDPVVVPELTIPVTPTEKPDLDDDLPPASSTLDSDNDGLTDAEEARYGTDAERADTDNDGLTDKDEVEKYGTDPLDPDTDGDTFLDGVEVISGYDPKGPGKLTDLPK